jgi:tRNA(adenine34) deaminase
VSGEARGLEDEALADENFMRRCLALAEVALAHGETPVGSLLVRAGRVIAEEPESSRGRFDPAAHAEMQVVREACRRERTTDLSGCTLYTTVEPCVLCAYGIRRTGIGRVVYGVAAGQLGGVTSRYALLADSELAGWPAPPAVVAGVLARECREILDRRAALR